MSSISPHRFRTAAGVATLLSVATLFGCRSNPVTYHSKVRVQRAIVVSVDQQNKPLTADVTFTWSECPGVQRQTVRSGKDLASCVSKLEPGGEVPVAVVWEKEDHGGYDWHVIELAGCKVPPIDDDDSSFEAVQDCQPTTRHDAVLGFHCDRVPKGELLDKCPWFRRK